MQSLLAHVIDPAQVHGFLLSNKLPEREKKRAQILLVRLARTKTKPLRAVVPERKTRSEPGTNQACAGQLLNPGNKQAQLVHNVQTKDSLPFLLGHTLWAPTTLGVPNAMLWTTPQIKLLLLKARIINGPLLRLH